MVDLALVRVVEKVVHDSIKCAFQVRIVNVLFVCLFVIVCLLLFCIGTFCCCCCCLGKPRDVLSLHYC